MSIEVFRDRWGIPHLRAGSALELAFAQGRYVALDRAWQIEVERHRAQGTSAAFLGSSAVAWDRFARQAQIDDTARRCFLRLDADTAAWVSAYVDGVISGLAAGAMRAPELAAVGLVPGRWQRWTPLAIWLSANIFMAGFPNKLWREEVIRRLGLDAVELFATDGPAVGGSNGWLIAGDRTATGAALLAGDPHRFVEVPGVYQQIRLACPEYDVVGLAVPGVPGLAHFGHAGRVAWAITNAMADCQDLYRERLRRRGGAVEVFGPDGWAPASVRVESIEVAGSAPIDVEIIETARGPVIIGGPGDAEAISLRCPARVREELGFEALPALLRATRVADVDRALDRWIAPVNVVQAADTEGGLLHRVAGAVPERHADNRWRVVPAWEADHEWTGWHAMPRQPVERIAVMANERGLAGPLGVEFAPPYRADRIRQLLDERAAWSATDMAALHMDTLLPSAGPLLALVRRLGELGPAAARVRDRLLGWDLHMDAASTDAALYAAVRASAARRLAAHPALAPLAELGEAQAHTQTQTQSLAGAELFHPWLSPAVRIAFALEGLLATDQLPAIDRLALVRDAVEDVAARVPDPPPWGELHRLAPWQALPDEIAAWPGLAGDHDCVLCTSSIPGVTHHVARAPVARYVWDLARREDSLWVVPLGASGVPGDHARDQLPLWVRGELVPVETDWSRLAREPDPGASRRAIHEQVVPDFGTIRVAPVDPAADLELIHGWVTQERARFWGMLDHTREQVREIYDLLDSLDTHHAYLVHRDGVPRALFQTYEPAADPIGEHYDVEPGDLGIHLMIGPPPGEPERGFTGTILAVLLAHVLRDPAVQRIVVEPDARNARAIARFVRSGFALGPEIQLPHKPARLAFLHRG